MATIFDGLKKASDEQIADQIALLETITLGNVLRPYGKKIHKSFVTSVKKIGGLFGKNVDIDEPEVKEIQAVVEEKRLTLNGLPRTQLDATMHRLLSARSSCTPGTSDDGISARVIDEAGSLLKISDELTPAQKADRVYEKFYERMLENFQKELKKRNQQQVDRDFDAKIQDMSDVEREEIQKILQVEKLTGESMRAALLKSGAPALILGAVSAAGFGGFIALTTIMHALFTTVLGITLPFAAYTGASSVLAFITGPVGWLVILGVGSWQMISGSKKIDQEMLAQSVWLAVVANGGRLTPSNEELPSWVPQASRGDIEANDKAYTALVSERDKAIEEVQSSVSQLKYLQKQLSQTEASLDSERQKRQSAEKARTDLEAKQFQLDVSRNAAEKRLQSLEREFAAASDAAEDVRTDLSLRLDSARVDFETGIREIESNRRKIAEQEGIIDYASSEITRKEEEIESIQAKNKTLEIENRALKFREEKVLIRTETEEEGRRKELESLWRVHFGGFTWRGEMIREAAKHSFSDRCKLEKVLRELHDAKDPHTVRTNRGKLETNGSEHIRVDLSGSQWRIEYQILKNQVKAIELIKLYKKGQGYMD